MTLTPLIPAWKISISEPMVMQTPIDYPSRILTTKRVTTHDS